MLWRWLLDLAGDPKYARCVLCVRTDHKARRTSKRRYFDLTNQSFWSLRFNTAPQQLSTTSNRIHIPTKEHLKLQLLRQTTGKSTVSSCIPGRCRQLLIYNFNFQSGPTHHSESPILSLETLLLPRQLSSVLQKYRKDSTCRGRVQ